MISLIVFALVAAAVLIIYFTKKSKKNLASAKDQSVWAFHSNTKNTRLLVNEKTKVQFRIPPWPGIVNYVWKRRATPIDAKYLVISGVITASTDAVVAYSQNGMVYKGSCKMRPIIQHETDDWHRPNGRFWSRNYSINLTPGNFKIKVPLHWENWTNVFGKESKDGFKAALKSPGRVGVTLGGGDHYGHGVYMLDSSMTVFIKEFKFTNA